MRIQAFVVDQAHRGQGVGKGSLQRLKS
ncbi:MULTISPECIES: hypothetical protein [Acinetobacter]|nr:MULTISPECIES: hypothetical protein [Acinetobacter]UOH76397.1 hypothetical protein MOW08_04390 [Acinetobacter schindleri]